MGNPLRGDRKTKKISFGKEGESIFREAVAEELKKHRLAGNPVVVYRSGQIVWLSPEEVGEALQKRVVSPRVKFRLLRVRKRRVMPTSKQKIRERIAAVRRAMAHTREIDL